MGTKVRVIGGEDIGKHNNQSYCVIGEADDKGAFIDQQRVTSMVCSCIML